MQNIDIKDFTIIQNLEDGDYVIVSLSNGMSGKARFGILKSLLTSIISPNIRSGMWYVGDKNLGVQAEGKTPQFRKSSIGIEYKYTSESSSEWKLLVPISDISFKIEDLTEEQLDYISLKFEDLTDEDIAELQRPATEMIAELERTNTEVQRAEEERTVEFEGLKKDVNSAIESANDTANHPTYIGDDNFVYVWNKDNKTYSKTNVFVKGDDGKEPVIVSGSVTTLEPNSVAEAELLPLEKDENGKPVYQLNLSIPKGEKGEGGGGSGNVYVNPSNLVSEKTYLFKPNSNNSAEGTFVEYEIPNVDTSELEKQIESKQDAIEDLESIREGAALGATALQNIPSNYVTTTMLEEAIEEAITNTLTEKV